MKLHKLLFIATALLGGVFVSCNEDGYWDQASQNNLWLTNGTAYAFDNTTINYTYYPVDVMKDMDVNVTVTRGTTEGTMTLPIAGAFSNDDLISGPESVTFQDGSNTAVYPIHVKQEFEPGVSATAKLVIDSTKVGIPAVAIPESLKPGATHEDSVKYKADSTARAEYVKKLSAYKLATVVTIQKDYNWKSLGMGTWLDTYFWGTSAEVEILQAVEDPKKYRVMLDMEAIVTKGGDEVDGNQSTQTTITLLDKGQEFRGVTIDGDGYVYWTPINTGYKSGDLDVIAYHPLDFSTNWARYNNTSYVSKYQKDGTPAIIDISGLMLKQGTSSGWAPCQSGSSIAQIVFPGVKIYNYGAKIEYAGLFTNPENVVYALADYELTGSDAKKAEAFKVAVISQSDDAEAVADAIAAGEYPAYDLEDVLKNGRIQIEIPEGLTGKLQIILVIIDKNEAGTASEVKNVVAAKFEYFGGANPWQSIGVGYYTEDIIYSTFTQEGGTHTYQVEIEENTATPGLYRLKSPYAYWATWWGEGDGEADIEIHAEDANGVYILDQYIGLTLEGVPMSFETRGGYLIAVNADYDPSIIINYFKGQFGTLADGVISFPLLTTEASDGSIINYSGYLNVGDNFYNVGKNGKIEVVLPNANASSVARAKRAAAASDFGRRLSGVSFKKSSIKGNVASVKMLQNFSK